MRLIVSTICLLAVAYAVPVIISEERINAILEKLRRAHAIGEFAVNTPTGIYPIKDINRNNLRQIFNFAPASAKDVDTDLEDHKAVPDVNIDSEPVTKEKDELATTPKDTKTVEKPSHASGEAKTTKTTKLKSIDGEKGKVTKTTDEKAKKTTASSKSEDKAKTKSTEASSEDRKKAESTKSAEESTTDAGKVETTEAAEVSSTDAAEPKEVTASSTAAEAVETTPLDVIDEHALNTGANETAPDAGDTIAGEEKNSTETGGTVAEGEEAANKITDTTNSTDDVTDPPTAGPAEAGVVTEVKEDVVSDNNKGSASLSDESAPVKRSDKSSTAQAHKHLEIEGSGELHEDVNEGSGTTEDTTSPVVDSTTLLTGNGSENAGDVIAAKGSTKSLPTITIPQNPEEPYVFVPVQSFKGQQLPGTSYLLIPKKYENKVSDYLTSKTS